MSRSRKCAVPSCGVFVPRRDLMCRAHWAFVPYSYRALVAKGQRAVSSGKLDSAALDAIVARAAATVEAPPAPPGAPHAGVTYSGCRITSRGRLIACAVTRGGEEFRPHTSRILSDHAEGFEWGYTGAGPAQLALALVLDATADEALALACHQWYKWAGPAQWGASWLTTAGEIRAWVDQWRAEEDTADVPAIATEGGAL